MTELLQYSFVLRMYEHYVQLSLKGVDNSTLPSYWCLCTWFQLENKPAVHDFIYLVIYKVCNGCMHEEGWPITHSMIDQMPLVQHECVIVQCLKNMVVDIHVSRMIVQPT